ncbi:pentapeptide repeat-containing protein [Ferrimonas balearica]|nr:pentapeptide repeat-containing protein [Ferrimonas balearica]
MPKHDPLLTLGILGTAFWISLVFSTASFGHMRRKLRRRERRLSGHIFYKTTGALAALAIFTLSWTSTIDSVLDTYFRFVVARGEAYKDLDPEELADKQLEWVYAFEFSNRGSLWLKRPSILAPADLAGVTFSQLPPDWLSWEVDQQEGWPDWCADHGVPREVCDQINPDPWSGEIERPAGGTLDHLTSWCKNGVGHAPELSQTTCDEMIQALRTSYAADWAAARLRIIQATPTSELVGKDLRNANLRDAELQGANLGGAELQGANLRGAELQGADLGGAELQGADLGGAELQGADLGGAKLQGAGLVRAELQGADLGGAKLQGADLMGAKLHWADLGGAEFDAATKLSSASLQGALLSSIDFTNVPQIDAHLDPAQVFFDGSITLPGGITSDMPEWPYEDRRDVLQWADLLLAWHNWRREHHPVTLR